MDQIRIEMYASLDGLFVLWDANVFVDRHETCRWVGSASSALDANQVYAEAMRMVAGVVTADAQSQDQSHQP